MKQFLTVFRFTFLDTVRKKALIVSTVILSVVMIAACVLIGILNGGSDEPDAQATPAEPTAVYYLDEEGALPGAEEALASYGYAARQIGRDDVERVKGEINGDNSLSLIEVINGEKPVIRVFVKDFMNSVDTNALREALTRAWTQKSLSPAGLTDEEIAFATEPLSLYTEATGEMNMASYALGLVFTILIFFAVYMYGITVANSVATEKTSRVMETLVVSARPRNVLFGKCLATGAAGLMQMLVLGTVAVLSYNVFVPADVNILGLEFSLEGLSAITAVELLAYFILGYALYAMMNAVCGASVSRIEDVNSALMPVMFLALFSFYAGYMTSVIGSSGTFEAIARYLPFASPFGMPMRILNGQVSGTQVLASLGILAATLLVISAICVRLYEASVMYYGKRLKITDMFKLKN